MIQSLDIKKYGSYVDFVWEKGNANFLFNKINIIYGHNYTGKTTLSRIFHTLETREQHVDYKDADYEFVFQNGDKVKASSIESFNTDYIVRVFNSDFIKENLGWLHNRDGLIQPFAVLGSENVDIRNDISVLEKLIRNDESETGYIYDKINLDEEKNKRIKAYSRFFTTFDIENKMTTFAARIRGQQQIYGRDPYNKTHLQSDFASAKKSIPLTETEQKTKIKLLEERELPNIPYTTLEYASFTKIVNSSIELLSKTISVSDDLSELVIEDLIKKWVIEGVEHHEKDHNTCRFCGSPFPTTRWTQLKNHFNEESKELRDKITVIARDLATIIQKLEKQFNYKKTDFYITYHAEYLQLYEKWDKKKDEFVGELNALIGLLEIKGTKETEKLSFDFNTLMLSELTELDKEIETLIQSNNLKTNSLKNDKVAIKKDILLSDIKRFLLESEYDINMAKAESLKSERDASVRAYKAIETKIAETEKEIELMKAKQKDESKGADRVNKYLEVYFGRDEIKLVPVEKDGITQYEIKRSEVPANNLSDGEYSLISFCYFMSRIEDSFFLAKEILEDGTEAELPIPPNEKIIIYIDDPISSLDNNHVFFIFSMIEAKITQQKKLHQLFISTHNLDFLKYLKRLTGSGDTCAYFSIEKQKKGQFVKGRIVPMPLHLREYVTEFNYLFQQMYDMYKPVSGDKVKRAENSYTNFYSLPNNIRKFLELYTFYRYPNNASLMKRLELMFDDNVPALINRVINEFSHLTFIERAYKPFDIPELEGVVNLIFEKMKEIDSKQFDVLMECCQ